MLRKKIIELCVCVILLTASVLPVTGTYFEEQDLKYIDDDIIQPTNKEPIPIQLDINKFQYSDFKNRGKNQVLDYEFITEPATIMTSYYDYMPGSYSSHPIRLQTENGNGHYLTFFGQESLSATRRQFWAYTDIDGDLQDSGLITSYDLRQGYGGIGIHPATGDCIASWHENQGGGLYETALTYDDFADSGTPGSWQDTLIIPSTGGLEYIWPTIEVGPSPMGEGYVRIYQVANDYTQLPSGNPCEDVRIMYIDVENTITANLSVLLDDANWDYVTVFTDWRSKSCRPFQSFAIDYANPGKVAFIGFALYLEGDLGDMPIDEGAFVWESYDYGETWDPVNLYSDGPTPYFYKVYNPGFEGMPSQLEVGVAGYHNTALFDAEGNLHGSFLQSYGYTDADGSYYLPYFLPQAEIIWNGSEFIFSEVPRLQGDDPLSGHSVPWTDIDNLYPIIGWSTYPSADAGLFHENTQKQAINRENNWLAQLWVDGTYAQLGTDGDPLYTDYIQHPLIYLSISSNNGATWYPPILLTDINSELFDFSDQITVYPYLCDQIVDLGDNWGQVDLYYYDDNTFGSNVHGTGAATGGNITYCSVRINFPDPGEILVDAGGPYSDEVGEEIQFIGSAFGGFPSYTWLWDFGNGDTSTEQNPKYTYDEAGNFTISLTITDSADPPNQGADITTATIVEGECMIIIDIIGGNGIVVNVTNIDDKDFTDIPWNITIENGFIVFPREKSGIIDHLSAGELTIINMTVFGIGLGILRELPEITAKVGCAEKTVIAKIIFKTILIQS